MDTTQHVFKTLKENIHRLKLEREEVSNQLLTDRNDLQTINNSILQLTSEIEVKLSKIKSQEKRLADLEKALSDTEKSYQIIIQTTLKLASALEQESSHIKSKMRK